MKAYLQTMKYVLEHGELCPDRTKTGRLSVFGPCTQETYDLTGNVLPLVTTRKLAMKPFLDELFGMIKGSNKASEIGEKFWSDWAPDEEFLLKYYEGAIEILPEGETRDAYIERVKNHSAKGIIGPMYGVLWRKWPLVAGNADFSWIKSFNDIPSDVVAQLSQEFDKLLVLSNGELKDTKEAREQFIGDQYVRSVDQLNKVFLGLKRNPHSTHHRVTAFNPSLIGPHADPRENVMDGFGALSPCHTFFQFHVRNATKNDSTLDCHLYMGSSDVCLGRPYNIAFYSLLTIIMAHFLEYKPGTFTITSGNTHIYGNHIEQAKEQVKLTPLDNKTVVSINPDCKDLFQLKKEDLSFSEYLHLDPINYKANV